MEITLAGLFAMLQEEIYLFTMYVFWIYDIVLNIFWEYFLQSAENTSHKITI